MSQTQTPFERIIYTTYPETNCNESVLKILISDNEIQIRDKYFPLQCYGNYVETRLIITKELIRSESIRDSWNGTGADWKNVKLMLPFTEQEFNTIAAELIAELEDLDEVYESEDSLPKLSLPQTINILKQKIAKYEQLANKKAEELVKEFETRFNKTLTPEQEQELKEELKKDAGEDSGLGVAFVLNAEVKELLEELTYLADVVDTLEYIRLHDLYMYEHYFD